MSFRFVRDLPTHTRPVTAFARPLKAGRLKNPLRPHAVGWRPQPTGRRMEWTREKFRAASAASALRGEGKMKDLIDPRAEWRERQQTQRAGMLDRHPESRAAFQAAWQLRKSAATAAAGGAPHPSLVPGRASAPARPSLPHR